MGVAPKPDSGAEGPGSAAPHSTVAAPAAHFYVRSHQSHIVVIGRGGCVDVRRRVPPASALPCLVPWPQRQLRWVSMSAPPNAGNGSGTGLHFTAMSGGSMTDTGPSCPNGSCALLSRHSVDLLQRRFATVADRAKSGPR